MPSIYIYDSNQWGIWGIQHDLTIEVVSIADMVTKTLKVLDPMRDQNNLYFAGVGGVNYQSVGAKDTNDTTGDRSFQVDEDGNLKGGGGRYLHLLLNKVGSVHLYGLDDLQGKPATLMTAIGKSLGRGVSIFGNNTLLKYYADSERLQRTPTGSATLDREALKARLGTYTR